MRQNKEPEHFTDPLGSVNALDAVFERRLRTHIAAPLAVAFSGGGDSLALLLAAKTWAGANGRGVLALTVDHGLNPASADWTRRCGEIARRLGAAFQPLRWEGARPATGLPAAARAARHALLAEAARDSGARVILLGHTADDRIEAAAMRAEGSTVSDPAEWAPSPAWPQGRGVFLLRPMLGVRRAEIRDWLRERGETWIDDPANEDERFARARARSTLSSPDGRGGPSEGWWRGPRPGASEASGPESMPPLPPPRTEPSPPRSAWSPSPVGGGLTLPVTAPAAHIAAACLCAAGTSRPPRGDRLERLVVRLRSGEAFTATLAGARIASDGATAVFTRDPGRAGLPEVALAPGQPVVWDGRFEILSDRPGTVRALGGLSRRLPKAQQAALRALPATIRPTLPVMVSRDGAVSCPILADHPSVRATTLVLPRFEAAIGLVDVEPAV
ncbi:tRNA lysidine(34) synthetase TilS [Phenylobacterium sp.]|uniref:tRNA lysidine(34) synthetase TilS n=1 Tax=Phenylobacterium sp. TaxID=1871053 RepID=UPI00272FF5BD|nr:tRNA lysidine(34) synthetase TilS [Phenylobacterium sp.]MDP2213382.1 tRNA lysidine(34) synthetase TilS [Phenylobacterium sp.]